MSNPSESYPSSQIVAADTKQGLERLYGRNFGLAFTSQVGFVMANMLMAHYARWIVFLGGDLGDVGVVTGVGSVAGMLMRPWIGQWINRFGARNLWILGYIVFVVSSLGNLLLDNLHWTIYVFRAASFVGAAVVFSSSLTFVSQTAPPRRQTEAIGTLGVAGFLGIVCGPVLGDAILGVQGRTSGDFHNLFIVASALLVLPLTLLLFLPPQVADGKSVKLGLRDFISTVKQYWPGGVLLVNLVFGLCMAVMMVFLAHVVDDLGLLVGGQSAMGPFFVVYATVGLTIRLLLRRVPDRFGNRKVLIAGTMVMGLGMLAFLGVTHLHLTWLFIAAVLCGMGHALMFHTNTALVLESFPVVVRGTGSALSLMALDLGMVGGSPVLGLVADHWGYQQMFGGVAVLCFLTATSYLVACLGNRSRLSGGPSNSEARIHL